MHSGHLGLEPSSTQLSHLLKEARAAGEFKQHPQLALRYTQLAAERGIRGAAAALSHAYATGVFGVLLGAGETCSFPVSVYVCFTCLVLSVWW